MRGLHCVFPLEYRRFGALPPPIDPVLDLVVQDVGCVESAMTHHETSCGLVNPVSAVCELARRHGARTFVDATSSAGVEDLDVTRDRIDACVTSSGKCLHGAPGIALVCVRREWLAARGDSQPRSFSLDLRRYHDQLEANSQTPFTPAVPQEPRCGTTIRSWAPWSSPTTV